MLYEYIYIAQVINVSIAGNSLSNGIESWCYQLLYRVVVCWNSAKTKNKIIINCIII